jgi:pyruvate,water dikinase
VERLRRRDDTASPRLGATASDQDREEAMRTALGILAGDEQQQGTLRLAVESARRIAAWRERGKSNCIKVLHEARMALFELGTRLVREGRLTDPAQVFLVLEPELDLLVSDPESVTSLLADREKAWRALFDLEPPTFIDGSKPLPALESLPRRGGGDAAPVAPGEVLAGAAASAGRVRGRARVIHDTAHIESFEPGEILVAPQTDPSWAPLFMVAAGVVVDIGAMNSHAMIVSRELGIPCVAGVTGASRRIATGTLIEVDGAAGTVTVLQEEPARV